MSQPLYTGAPATSPTSWRNIAPEVRKSAKVPNVSICLLEGTTDAELLLIVLDELQTQDRSAKLAKVITSTSSVWWPCK